MTLAVLKHYNSWEKLAMKMPSMSELRANNGCFVNYPYALYATDVKFQSSERPAGRLGEAKPYFSAKHKMYGLKIEASVSPQGLLVEMSEAHRGDVADLTIMRSCMEQHQQVLKKTDQEPNIHDHGEQVDSHPSMWAALVDKGYYRAMADIFTRRKTRLVECSTLKTLCETAKCHRTE
ncbi:hypothetical protein H257_13684 [Aphanomyces astaci]|uniref:DDE Tnp4 domain-containing protein n=1 Tax=Aphanomyces astaci TaxID=112090 RepID=W4FVG6_APHAT|nr:hypothetical protein H257_13684 [Aphanomyces astaci]ETV70946.1 hypothetical protein H257_13684 [Aphanomyces astaci]|eukprot:XP_009839609.1 hypothetical protein H257_13684 [Aphanomyces astaci]